MCTTRKQSECLCASLPTPGARSCHTFSQQLCPYPDPMHLTRWGDKSAGSASWSKRAWVSIDMQPTCWTAFTKQCTTSMHGLHRADTTNMHGAQSRQGPRCKAVVFSSTRTAMAGSVGLTFTHMFVRRAHVHCSVTAVYGCRLEGSRGFRSSYGFHQQTPVVQIWALSAEAVAEGGGRTCVGRRRHVRGVAAWVPACHGCFISQLRHSMQVYGADLAPTLPRRNPMVTAIHVATTSPPRRTPPSAPRRFCHSLRIQECQKWCGCGRGTSGQRRRRTAQCALCSCCGAGDVLARGQSAAADSEEGGLMCAQLSAQREWRIRVDLAAAEKKPPSVETDL